MDIKQQNILLDRNLDAKITDFSISLPYENLSGTEKIQLPLAGTSLYMSPEVLLKSQIDSSMKNENKYIGGKKKEPKSKSEKGGLHNRLSGKGNGLNRKT